MGVRGADAGARVVGHGPGGSARPGALIIIIVIMIIIIIIITITIIIIIIIIVIMIHYSWVTGLAAVHGHV